MEIFKDNTIELEIIIEKYQYEYNKDICYTIYMLNSFTIYKYDNKLNSEDEKHIQILNDKLNKN